MAKERELFNMADDELDLSAKTEREHNPTGFRPHEILRVTAPMLSAVQEKDETATTVKKAWVWLCNKAGVPCELDWLDSRPVAQRVKSQAKGDTLKHKPTVGEQKLLDRIRDYLGQKGASREACAELLIGAIKCDAATAEQFINTALAVPDNPFL